MCKKSESIAIPEIEINIDSLHSLVLYDVFVSESFWVVNDAAVMKLKLFSVCRGKHG